MKIFVLWRERPGQKTKHTPESVGAHLQRLYNPLFSPEPKLSLRSCGAVHLAWLELPVQGFKPAFFEEAEGRFAFAPEYPLNARRLLRQHQQPFHEGTVLLTLASELQQRPEPYVRELIPPATLIWSAPKSAEVYVQNDGLGQAQLFEYESPDLWVLTNRVCAVRALDVALVPVAEEWAARFTTGWFPLESSGYQGLRYLSGGTQLRLGAQGIQRTRIDPLPDWLHPPARSRNECLEYGRHAILHFLEDAMELWVKPSVGLSGGWDSRAIVSCLRVLNSPFDLRVRGQETHFDVMISAELARIAGLPHRIKTSGGVPLGTAEGCRSSIAKALLWQAGCFTTLKHKTFLAKEEDERLDGGVVNVMGQHGGIGKADFAVKIRAHECGPEHYEERLVESLLKDAPAFLYPQLADCVRDMVRSAYRRAANYGLVGRGPLHYFFLTEFTRRWGSATLASQTGLVVAPFLCPEFIRACYGFPEDELPKKPMHSYITAKHAPEWAGVPYTDQATEEDLRTGRIPPVQIQRKHREQQAEVQQNWQLTHRFRKYRYHAYWENVGYPLLEQAFAEGGFWTTLFDPTRAQAEWGDSKGYADAIVIAHLLPKVVAQ